MKRHVAWLLSCGLLVGCASTPPPIDEPSAHPHTTTPTAQPGSAAAAAADSTSAGGASTSSTTPAAFHFKSGTLEIGDFDPYALGDNLFDPCTEISPEEFAAAGFENVEPIAEEYRGLNPGVSACFFERETPLFGMSLSNSRANRTKIAEEREIPQSLKSGMLPSLFVYGTGITGDTDCFAQVDTLRGGVVASISSLPGSASFEEACSLAISNLEELFAISQI